MHLVKDYESVYLRMQSDAKEIAWDIMRLNAAIKPNERESTFRLSYGRLTTDHYLVPSYIATLDLEGHFSLGDLRKRKLDHWKRIQTVQYIEVRKVKNTLTHKPILLCGFEEEEDTINWYICLQFKDRGDINHVVHEWREPFPYVHILLDPSLN